MKKILFVTPHMIIGGVEKALVTLLEQFPSDKYIIKILMVKAHGPLLNEIPKNVEYGEIDIPNNIADELLAGGVRASIKNNLATFKFHKVIKLIWRKMILKDPFSDLNISFKDINELQEEFDIAICYHMHMPFIVRYVSDKVSAKKKICWIHNDFNQTKYDVKRLESYLDEYDYFFAVSKQLETEFVNIIPKFQSKTSVFYNIISDKKIKRLANDGYCEVNNLHCNNKVKLITIGRLSYQKGYDLAINICKKLKEDNIDFCWFILGEGEEREKLERRIKELQLADYFILLGAKSNPYPYLKMCDIYIQTSRHEGYCTTLNEARILNKPIVTTNVSGVSEMLEHKKTALISNFDERELYLNILELINNDALRDKLSKNLEEISVNTTCEINKLLKICED